MIISILIGVSLLCAFSPTADNNRYYPTYQYNAAVGTTLHFSLPSTSAFNQSNQQYGVFSDSNLTFDARLYFTDAQSFLLTDFSFSWTWDIYIPFADGTVTYLQRFNDSYDAVNIEYTNQTFDNFNFRFIYKISEVGACSIDITNFGNVIDSNSYSSLPNNPVYGLTYTQSFSGDELYGQIQQYIDEIIGYQQGYDSGFSLGNSQGYNSGYEDGETAGYDIGYTDGYIEAGNQDATASVIFTGILEVGLLPINIFLAIFNYEVFGINISGLVASLLTVAVVIIIIRVILAKSGGSGGSKS